MRSTDTKARTRAEARGSYRTPSRRRSVINCRSGKPAPDIFLLAADQVGARPDRCLVYEDSDAGFTAALAAGMAAFDVRTYGLWPAGAQEGPLAGEPHTGGVGPLRR